MRLDAVHEPKPGILIMASTFPRGVNDNVSDFVFNFSKSLRDRWDVTVLAPHDRGAKYKEVLSGITVYRFPYALPSAEKLAYRGGMVNAVKKNIFNKILLLPFMVGLLIWTFYLCKRKKIHTVNAHWLFPQGIAASLLVRICRLKLIVTTHGGDIELLQKPLVAKLAVPVINNAVAITFVTKRNLKIAEKKFLKNRKFKILTMGIYVKPNLIVKRKILGTPQIIFMGRLVNIKGAHVLIQALYELKRSGVRFKVIIAGDGPESDSLQELSKEKGLSDVIDFAGHVNGAVKERLLSSSDIAVIPSIIDSNGHQEGLPVSAMEACAHGLSIVATNTGGIPEIINESNGHIVSPTHMSIYLALKDTIEHYEKYYPRRKNAYATALSYDWPTVAATFRRIADNELGRV